MPENSNDFDQARGGDQMMVTSFSASCSKTDAEHQDDGKRRLSLDQHQHIAVLELQEMMGPENNPCFDEETAESHHYDNPSSSITTAFDSSHGGSSCISCFKRQGKVVVYLSTFAIIGSSIRVYLGRIFGLDCEFPPEQKDYISKIATCITATGLTEQRGGALFIDLPANMVGSFLLGVMTPTTYSKDGTAIDDTIGTRPIFPCFHHRHRIQRSSTTHLSLTVALCGSMTTFSSWNSQMITMMVGENAILGSQVCAAIMGYVLGLVCSVASFSFGRIVGKALYACRQDSEDNVDQDDENENEEGRCKDDMMERNPETHTFKLDEKSTKTENSENYINNSRTTTCNIWVKFCRRMNTVIHGKFFPLLLVSMLLTSFFIGDFKMSSSFHKQMWISSLLSPPGTILRWILSRFNSKQLLKKRDHVNLTSSNMGFPYGTFLANQLGCIVSIIAVATLSRLDSEKDNISTGVLWLGGMKTGFAANLSTVSTFAKEIVLMFDEDRVGFAFSYAMVTIIAASLVSLLIYKLLV